MAPVGAARTVAALAAAALVAAGCGEAGSTTRTSSDTLTIFVSLPLRGERAATSAAILNGTKLALAEAGGRAGQFKLRFTGLDDSLVKGTDPARWDPGQTAANARRAAQDRDAIAYIGEVDSGSTAISVPITNEAGILQVSPASTYTGLTRGEGGDKGEPEKYYPSGTRTFGRVVPGDQVQAPALVQLLRKRAVHRIFIVRDADTYAGRLAAAIARRGRADGLRVVGDALVADDAAAAADAAREIVASRADAVVYTGGPAAAPALWRAVRVAKPELTLFGTAALADARVAAQLGRSGARTFVTSPSLGIAELGRGAEGFAARYEARFHRPPPPYAIQGYEAMAVVIAAIRAAGARGNDRREVIREFFRTERRRSVLGTYSIDVNGDTTLSQIGAYRIVDGRLRPAEVLDPVSRP